MAVNINDPKNEFALRTAANEGAHAKVEALIAAKVDVNAAGQPSQKTALHWAAKGGHEKVVNLLLAAGANPLVYDKDKKTPLAYAEDNQHQDIVAALKEKMALPEKEEQRFSELHKAIISKDSFPKFKVEHGEKVREKIKKLQAEMFRIRDSINNNEQDIGHLNIGLSNAVGMHLFKKARFVDLTEKERAEANDFLKNRCLCPFSVYANQFFLNIDLGFTPLLASPPSDEFVMLHAQGLLAQSVVIISTMGDIIGPGFLQYSDMMKPYLSGTDVVSQLKACMGNSIELIDSFLRTVMNVSLEMLGNPPEFIDFLRKYFPKLRNLFHITTSAYSLYTQKALHEKDSSVFISVQKVVTMALNEYFQDCLEEYRKILVDNAVALKIGLVKLNRPESDAVKVITASLADAKNFFEGLISTLCYNAAVAVKENLAAIPVSQHPMFLLMPCFFIRKKFIAFEKQRLIEINTFLNYTTKMICDRLRREFLDEYKFQQPTERYELERAQEKKTQREGEEQNPKPKRRNC